MPSHRKIPAFRSKQWKATTPLQQQLLNTRAKDLKHAEASNAALLNRLNPANVPQVEEPLVGEDFRADVVEVHDLDQDDEVGQQDDGIDLNRFMPGPGPPPMAENANDPLLAALRREAHLGDRLAHENQWLWQYAIMLPTFLRGRLTTSNWGDPRQWDADFRRVCNYSIRTERDIDLVDLLSKCSRTPSLFIRPSWKFHPLVI